MEVLQIEQLIRDAQKSLSQVGLTAPDQQITVLEEEIPPFFVRDTEAFEKLLMLLLSEADPEHPVSFGVQNRSRINMMLTVKAASGLRTDRYQLYLKRLEGKILKNGTETAFGFPCTPLPDHEKKPPISLKAIVQEVGDEETAKMIVNQYIDHLKEQLPIIRTALDRDDYITAHREAHSIKGGAMNIHAPALAEEAKRLERNAKNGSLELGYSMLETITGYITEIESYLKDLNRGAKNDAFSPGPLR